MQELSCPGCQISGGLGGQRGELWRAGQLSKAEREGLEALTPSSPASSLGGGGAAVAGGRPGQGGWRRLPRTPG